VKPYYEDTHAGIVIWHADCRDVLPQLQADVLVTDPPYGVNGSFVSGDWGDAIVLGDESTELRDYVLAWWGGRPAIVFGSWKAGRPVGLRAVLVWDKGDAVGSGDLTFPWKATSWEEIYILGHGFAGHRGPGVLRYNAISPNFVRRDHPTQKPIVLMRQLIAKCPTGIILDPFAGVGTTLRAAKDLGRRAIGIEIEERYCEIAARRLSQEVLPLEAVPC
jgi:site-specific DNA-methyltransferase (adenine-specific)